MNISLSAFTSENLVSRDGFGSPVLRQSAHLHTQAESGAYLRNSSQVPRRRPFIYFKPSYAIGSVPSLSGPAIAYRWRSLPESAGIGPVSPKVVPNECCLGRSPWYQSICASLSHTHYWYEVGMLKVSALCTTTVTNMYLSYLLYSRCPKCKM